MFSCFGKSKSRIGNNIGKAQKMKLSYALLQKIGLGQLPGDFRFHAFGRDWFIPLASTVLLSFVVGLIQQLL